MNTNAEVVSSTNRVKSTGSRTSTIETRPSSCAKAAGPRRQSSANASIHVAPARFKSPATTIGWKTSRTEPLRRSSCAKDACPRHQRNVNRRSKVKRVAKVRELSSHTATSERTGNFSHVRNVRINSRTYYKRAHSRRPSVRKNAPARTNI